ncbi:MAG: CvpA family protein [Firmicutes bacterium]|nr:CvpA family protein [Bacillota bacterium]
MPPIVDIVIIVLVLATAVFGFFKGFIKSLVSLLGFVVSLTLAILLSKVVANALLGIDGIGNVVAGGDKSLYTWLNNMLPEALKNISTADLGAAAADPDALVAESGIKEQLPWWLTIFYPLVNSSLTNPTYLNAAVIDNARQIIALELSYSIYVLIVGIALFVVIRILAAIISIVFKRYMDKKSVPGRLLGGVLGAGKGVIYSMIILLVISLMSNFGFMGMISEKVSESKVASALTSATHKITAPLLKGDKSDKRYERLIELVGIVDGGEGPEAGG